MEIENIKEHIDICIKEIESDIEHKKNTIERTKKELWDKRVLLNKFKQMKNEQRNII